MVHDGQGLYPSGCAGDSAIAFCAKDAGFEDWRELFDDRARWVRISGRYAELSLGFVLGKDSEALYPQIGSGLWKYGFANQVAESTCSDSRLSAPSRLCEGLCL